MKNKPIEYSKVSSLYKFRPRVDGKIYRSLQNNRILNKKNTILDLGSGNGFIANDLYKRGFKNLVALEPSKKMILKSNLFKKMKIKIINKKFENYNFQKNCFDVIVSCNAFNHVNFNSAKFQINKILKKDGYLVIMWVANLFKEGNNKIQYQHLYKILGKKFPFFLKKYKDGLEPYKSYKQLRSIKYLQLIKNIKSRHRIKFPFQNYIGVWESSVGVKKKLGLKKFKDLINFIKKNNSHRKFITQNYISYAWVFKKI